MIQWLSRVRLVVSTLRLMNDAQLVIYLSCHFQPRLKVNLICKGWEYSSRDNKENDENVQSTLQYVKETPGLFSNDSLRAFGIRETVLFFWEIVIYKPSSDCFYIASWWIVHSLVPTETIKWHGHSGFLFFSFQCRGVIKMEIFHNFQFRRGSVTTK